MKCLPIFLSAALLLTATVSSAADAIPVTSADGRVLNLGFEDGTLRDWTATGEAFAKQPVKGEIDQNRPFGKGKSANRKGEYWLGGYEILRDEPKGTLTSVEFKVTQPWASFLVGGGSLPGTRVEIVTKDDGKVIHTARGVNDERMARSVVDLRKFEKREIFIRIVDEETVGWGHVNFDDFIFHAEEPKFPADQLAQKSAKPAPGNTSDPNLKPDDVQFAGLPAEKAAQVATVPAGYELKVFAAEPDIVNPIAFCMDDRARIWVVEGMTYPQRAKTEPGAPEWLGGKDRILVFEDTDGDGHFDKRTVFMEGLNLVSGIEVGFGGVFVGAAPNLIFIPVENWDDPKPGKVEVLLNGWGDNDTHETLNTFHWGPDGWLYGCHGVFTHSLVGKPGTPMPGVAKNAPDENAAKELRDELAVLEKEMQKLEDERNAFRKVNNVGILREDANSAAKYLTKLHGQLAVLKYDLESIAAKQDVPADKARGASMRVHIQNLEQTISIWEGKRLALDQRLAEWGKIEAPIQGIAAQMDRITGKLMALGVGYSPEKFHDELVRLENELKKEEAEMADMRKVVNIALLHEEGNTAATTLTDLNHQAARAKTELDLIPLLLNVPVEKQKEWSDGLREKIKTMEESIKTWETKALDIARRIADWDKNESRVERTKQQIERITARQREVDIAKNEIQKPAEQRVPLNAGIWRYQPQRREFEVFAHGTSNPWGIDWNADGDLFAEACVIPHLFHIIQGARYQRQAGQHFDPHTYDDIKTIADHRHYLGATPHSGNGKSDTAGGGHAHAGLCIPQHPSWPDGIRGNVLMNNIHGARINMDVLERKGSGYVAHHGADFINFHDKASQIVDLREGPDGTLFMIDWYDLNQCHNPRREAHDYTTGRIFRLGRNGQIVKPVDFGKMTLLDLQKTALSGDAFEARCARRRVAELVQTPQQQMEFLRNNQKFLEERAAAAKEGRGTNEIGSIKMTLLSAALVFEPKLDHKLKELFVSFSHEAALDTLPPIMSWSIRMAVSSNVDIQNVAWFMAKLAGVRVSPIVRLALASACQRLTVEQRKPIVLALLAHGEDADDANLPLMDWYAAEPIVAADPAWAAEALGACKIPKVSEFIARRMSEK